MRSGAVITGAAFFASNTRQILPTGRQDLPLIGKFCRALIARRQICPSTNFPRPLRNRRLANRKSAAARRIARGVHGAKRPLSKTLVTERRQECLASTPIPAPWSRCSTSTRPRPSCRRPRMPSTRGMKVASAKDNGAIFAIAQNMRGDVAGYHAVHGQPQPRHVDGRRRHVGRPVDLRPAHRDEDEGAGRFRHFARHGEPSAMNEDFVALRDQISTDRHQRRSSTATTWSTVRRPRSRRWRPPTARAASRCRPRT